MSKIICLDGFAADAQRESELNKVPSVFLIAHSSRISAVAGWRATEGGTCGGVLVGVRVGVACGMETAVETAPVTGAGGFTPGGGVCVGDAITAVPAVGCELSLIFVAGDDIISPVLML